MLLPTAAATAEHSGLCVCGVVVFMFGGVQAPSKPSDRQKSAGSLLRPISQSLFIHSGPSSLEICQQSEVLLASWSIITCRKTIVDDGHYPHVPSSFRSSKQSSSIVLSHALIWISGIFTSSPASSHALQRKARLVSLRSVTVTESSWAAVETIPRVVWLFNDTRHFLAIPVHTCTCQMPWALLPWSPQPSGIWKHVDLV